MFAHVEWAERGSASPLFVWAHAAETKANRRPAESTAGIWSLGCANPPELKLCHNLAAKVLAVIRFQTPAKHVISVTQPVPHIQKAWKSLKLSAFPGAPVLVAQEQSEDEQLILVLFFHAEVLRACCFVLAFSCCFLNSNIFKIRTLRKPYPFPQSTLILYASKSVNIESWSD